MKKKAKPVRAWAIIGASGKIDIYDLFERKVAVRDGWQRVARVEIREVQKKRKR